MLRDIIQGQLFGKVAGLVYSIEFQKRGLPHSHMLIILDRKDKFDELRFEAEEIIEKINKTVSAEIPDPKKDKQLYDLVC